MHGIVYQISTEPVDLDDYISEDTVSVGDMAVFDYLYDTEKEVRQERIHNLVENVLPKGMFTIAPDGEAIIYQEASRRGESRISNSSEPKPQTSTRKISWSGLAPPISYKRLSSTLSVAALTSLPKPVVAMAPPNVHATSCSWWANLKPVRNSTSAQS